MEPRAFRLLLKWIDSQKTPLELDIVDVPTSEEGSDSEEESKSLISAEVKEACEAQDLALAQLWITADRLLIPRLQNEVMVAFHQLWEDDNNHRACSTS